MKKGDLVRVTWPDGLEMVATYIGEERGFAILKTKDNKRTLAAEILVNNNAIGNLIREAKSSQVYSQIQVGAKFGMQTLEQSLSVLIKKGLISIIKDILPDKNNYIKCLIEKNNK